MKESNWIFVTALTLVEYDGKCYDRDMNFFVRKGDLDGLIIEHKVQRIHHKNIQTK